MRAPNFNLVDEPWLPCLTSEGKTCALSLREALQRAHELGELSADPPATAALTRLLVAVVHRSLDGPKTRRAWAGTWGKGRFDPAAVDAYLDRWKARFDLFDPLQPFFQAPLDHTVLKPPSLLDPAAAQGNNPTLFDHSMDGTAVPLPADEAARRLVALQAFAAGGLMSGEAGGRVSGKAALLSGSWVFLVSGRSLFHTLLLNTPVYNPAEELPFAVLGEDAPVWERPPSSSAVERNPAGWLDLLTYPSRRVQLVPDPDAPVPQVCHVKVTDGDHPAAGWGPRSRELSLAFTERPTGWAELRPAEGRDLWRDATVLFCTQVGGSERPRVVEHVATMVVSAAVGIEERLGLDAYALATNKAKYLYWRHERLPLRTGLFHTDAASEAISSAVEGADRVAKAIQRAVAELAGRPDRANLDRDERKRRRMWAEHAMGEFWARLAPGFDQFLAALPDEHSAFDRWSGCLGAAVEGAWSSWSASFSATPAGFRRVAQADHLVAMARTAARHLREEAT